ncbi:MAG: rhodanese-like domain-containing protein [Nitrospirae bacterium]|nr:rhodanese-like domain-containing protein [Nitrospirota bacterium]
MERKKKIYLLYAGIFISIIAIAITNYLIKMAEMRRSMPVYTYLSISSKELMDMMKQNNELIIIDTRIKELYEEGHIKGAANFSYTSLRAMDKVLKKELSKEIVFYSEDGDRSRKICDVLVTLGYSKLKNLEGGIKGWKEAGGEVVKEP